MTQGVFDDRLQNQIGNRCIEDLRIDIHADSEPVLEPNPFDLQIGLQEFELPPQRDFVQAGRVQRQSQKVAESCRHSISRFGVGELKGRYRVQGVEEKVRLELRLQRLQFGFSELPLELRRPKGDRDHIPDEKESHVTHKPGWQIEEEVGAIEIDQCRNIAI